MSLYHEALDPLRGRCAVAAVALPAGARLLHAAATCAVSLPSSSCSACFASHVALARCTGCRLARYCSRRCQQRDWPHHRCECPAWRSIPAARASATLLLVTRLSFKLWQSSVGDAHERRAVLQLCHHLDDHPAPKRRAVDEMTQLVLLLLARYRATAAQERQIRCETLEKEIPRLFGRVHCNAFSIAHGVTNAVLGIGLFPEGALLNHDCEPNCVVSFQGRELVVHVVKEVAVGQELTVSYVELLQSTHARRRELKASYFFDCQCTRCRAALAEATAGEVKDDWYLDGLVCTRASSETCRGVVVLEEKAMDGIDGAAVCRVCGAARDRQEIDRWEKLLQRFDAALSVDSKQEDKWNVYQQKWALLTQQLQLHPRNARVAAMARDIGNFLVEATSPDLQRRALPFFLAELRAVEWLLPKTKLPSRGLLHFQIGKLMFDEAKSSRVDAAQQLESAAKHLHEALSTYDATLEWFGSWDT